MNTLWVFGEIRAATKPIARRTARSDDLFMDAVLPLDQMTVEEKLRAMEAIWRSLSTREEQVPVPDWHKQVLDERQRQIDAGEARFVSLEEMKERVRKRTE